MKRVLGIILAVAVVCAVVGCTSEATTTEQKPYTKFQDRMSMDWDIVQHWMLIDTAIYYAGYEATPEEYAHNIIVSLNLITNWDDPRTFEEVCILFPEGAYRPDAAIEGMYLVQFERWDETNGSLEYIRH